MRYQWRLMAALLLLLVGLGVPSPALALSCIPLPDVIARMDVIVRGQIRVIETGALELAVSRYYKGGSGPARLRAEVRGLGKGERMDWSGLPRVGDELIIGFVKSGESLVNDACHLFVQLAPGQEPEQQVRDLIGPGQAPDPGVVPRPAQEPETSGSTRATDPGGASKSLLWPFGVALLSLGLAFWVIRRWRRRSA